MEEEEEGRWRCQVQSIFRGKHKEGNERGGDEKEEEEERGAL